MNNIGKIVLGIAVTVSFTAFGCAQPNDWPSVEANPRLDINGQHCAQTTDDVDGDCIPNAQDFNNNTSTCAVKCYKDDGTYTCKDCSLDADCNCNNVLDNEEMETTQESWWDNIPDMVKYPVIIGAGLTGAYFGGRAVNWFQGHGPDVTVTSVDFLSGSYLEFTDEASGYDKMNVHIVGNCDWEGHTDVPCNMDIVANILPVNWNNVLGYKQFNLNYFIDLKDSPIYSKDGNYIKVSGYDPVAGKNYDYILKDPSWLGIRTGINGQYNETNIYTKVQVPAYLQLNVDDLSTTAVDERSCFSNATGVDASKNYIFAQWFRKDNSLCASSGLPDGTI